MKKLFIFTATIVLIIVMSTMNVSAVDYNKFIEEYPNDYIYRINFPNGDLLYISSPAELQFELEPNARSGDNLIIVNHEGVTYYRLKSDGTVLTTGGERFIVWDGGVGFEGDIDIYIWSGNGFFLTLPSLLGKILRVIRQMIQMIMTTTGFGIVSLVVLVKLLRVLKALAVGL